MTPHNPFILAAVTKLGQRAIDIIEDRPCMRMRLGDHDMQAREGKRWFNRLHSVGHAERFQARSGGKLSLDDAIDTATVEQPETLLYRRRTNEGYLSILQPVAAILIEFLARTDRRTT